MKDWGSIVTAAAALFAAISSVMNRKKIQELHIQINSRMDAWIELARRSAHAEGKLEQRMEDDDKARGAK